MLAQVTEKCSKRWSSFSAPTLQHTWYMHYIWKYQMGSTISGSCYIITPRCCDPQASQMIVASVHLPTYSTNRTLLCAVHKTTRTGLQGWSIVLFLVCRVNLYDMALSKGGATWSRHVNGFLPAPPIKLNQPVHYIVPYTVFYGVPDLVRREKL